MNRIISFDYAIKTILRDKADYDIIEGFINALLQDYGYGKMKVKAPTDPELNKSHKKQKKSIADFLIVDETGKTYTIEVDRNPTGIFSTQSVFYNLQNQRRAHFCRHLIQQNYQKHTYNPHFALNLKLSARKS
jgi:predicted transposase/invertase (TIGR01784 family)